MSLSRRLMLGFAGACALGSVYGFLQGAWPFGGVEAIWSLVALRRWYTAMAAQFTASPSNVPKNAVRRR